MSFRPPGECPACGCDVPAKARACPECGADERSGWSEDADTANLDLPNGKDDFDYQDFLAREFGDKAAKPKRRVHPLWLVVAALLALLLLWLWVLAPLLSVSKR